MPSLITRVSPVLDGPPQILGDGTVRLRHIIVGNDYTPPVYLSCDSSVRKVYKLDSLPVELDVIAGRVSILSGDPGAEPTGQHYYVSTTGSASNSGSITSPWTFEHALAGAGGVLRPGDTVWMRGGTYGITPTIYSNAAGPHGLSTNRIVFRQYGGDAPYGERVTINGQWNHKRDYWDLRGVELFNSDPVNNQFSNTIMGTEGGSAIGARTINVISHDAGETGATGWLNSRGPSLYYGVICYNNGTIHNKDHGFYIHDQEKVLDNCIAFNNLARNFQYYDSSRSQKNNICRNCIAWGAAEMSATATGSTNFLFRVTNSKGIENLLVEGCVGFHKDASASQSRQLRLGAVGVLNNKTSVARNNYFWRGRTCIEHSEWENLVFEDNTIVNDATCSDNLILNALPSVSASWERNKWYGIDPTQAKWKYRFRRTFPNWQTGTALGSSDTAFAGPPPNKVFLFPNDFDQTRAHLAICNHEGLASVPVDLSAVVPMGRPFEIRNVQDLWGTPVVAQTYYGGTVDVPMAGITAPVPSGPGRVFSQPPVTGPEFNAFLVKAL